MGKRVLLVNKFYYPRGGDCVCTMNLESLLRANGHEVAVFAMRYAENVESEYSGYFAPEVDFAGGMGEKIAAARRIFGLGDVRESFERILDDFKPDVVHLQNIHSYISPIVGELAKSRGCKVLWTLHDYKLLCPAYTCKRDGKPCELCFTHKTQVLRHRCMKGSMAASALAYLEAKKWSRQRLERHTDIFVCPSSFMAQKMCQGGFNAGQMKVLCNFIDPEKLALLESTERVADGTPYYTYVGRLSEEKGVRTLLEVASRLPYVLKIAGDGPLADELAAKYRDCTNIEFLGRKNAEEVSRLLSGAVCSVVPSEWYENNPLSVIESLCAGTPVIGAEIGGIPELIDGATGMTFTSGDAAMLGDAVKIAMARAWNNLKIKADSMERFSPKKYLEEYNKILMD